MQCELQNFVTIVFYLFTSFYCSSSSGNGKKLYIPPELFECIGDVPGKNNSYYKCLFPKFVPKKKKDGSKNPLTVCHNSRSNARHVLVC